MNKKIEKDVRHGEECNYKTNKIIFKCPECRKVSKYGFDEKLHNLITNSLTDKIHIFEDENKKLKSKISHKETTINQINDILNEIFGVTHDIASNPDEFKEILKEKIENSKTIADFIQTEPIKVADMLISAEIEPKKIENGIELIEYKRNFNISELRQIAEHLLIYCNANESEET